jgi:hypothetical protein
MRWKDLRKLLWITLVALLLVGSGCQRDEQKTPTMPGSAGQKQAASPANFYAREGISDEFGAYVGAGEFVIQTPAGEYLLEYTTLNGTFYVAFRATGRALVYIFLVADDRVQTAIIYPGTIIDETGLTQTSHNVTLFAWPGSDRDWQAVFRKE